MSTEVPIAKRKLGKTNLWVTPIGLGMMEFAGGGGLMGFVLGFREITGKAGF